MKVIKSVSLTLPFVDYNKTSLSACQFHLINYSDRFVNRFDVHSYHHLFIFFAEFT